MSELQSTWYTATCPGCAGDAIWHSTARNLNQPGRTSVTYRIDCDGCPTLADFGRTAEPLGAPLLARTA
jgi:hypothetical protein